MDKILLALGATQISASRMSHFVVGLCMIAVTLQNIQGGVPDKEIGQLQEELGLSKASAKQDPKLGVNSNASAYAEALAGRLSSSWSQQNFEYADQILNQLSQSAPNAKVAKILTQLQSLLQTDRQQVEQSFVEKTDALLGGLGNACKSAKTEKDLDVSLAAISALKNSAPRSGSSEVLQRTSQKLESATRFARRWQDYIAQCNAGNGQAAAQIMSELANDNYSYPILPRSEILARVKSVPPQVAQNAERNPPEKLALSEIKLDTLDDVGPWLETLRAAAKNKVIGQEDEKLIANVSALQAGLAALNSGNIGIAMEAGLGSNQSVAARGTDVDLLSVRLTKLRSDLLLLVIPKYLELPSSTKPLAGENPSEFLLRLLQNARTAGDWGSASHILECYEKVAFARTIAPTWIASEKSSISQYLIGRNCEAGGDLDQALTAYAQALRIPNPNTPVDDIGRRIARIKKALAEQRQADQDKLAQRARQQAHP